MKFFPRFFLLYFLVFHIYFFSYTYGMSQSLLVHKFMTLTSFACNHAVVFLSGFSYLALSTTAAFMQHLILYFWNRFEVTFFFMCCSCLFLFLCCKILALSHGHACVPQQKINSFYLINIRDSSCEQIYKYQDISSSSLPPAQNFFFSLFWTCNKQEIQPYLS